MRHSIQLQLPALLLLVGVLSILPLYHYLLNNEIESRKAEISRNLNATGTRLAGMSEYLLQKKQNDALHIEVSLLAQYPDLTLALVVDEKDRILHSSQPAWHHRPLEESPLVVANSLFQEARATMSGRVAEFDNGQSMVGAYAFQMPLSADDLGSAGTGIVVMSIDQTNARLSARQNARRIALTVGAALLLVALLLWYALHKLLTRPVQALVNTTRAFSEGDFQASANISTRNEMGELSTALDALGITARDREQTVFRNRRLAQIVETSVNEVYVAEASGYQIVEANRAARENLQYTNKDDFLSLHPWDFMQGITRENVAQKVAPLIDGSVEVLTVKATHKRKDGTTYPVETRLQYLAQQKPPVFSAISQDLTERQKQQAELHLRDRAIAEVDVGVLITDALAGDNPIVYANAAIEKLTGYSQDELLGCNPRILRGDDHEQPELEKIRQALSAQVPVQVLLRNYRKDGTRFMDELTLSPVRDEQGVVTHFIGIQRDVTERLATDARLLQAQKIDAIGQLSGGIAHDFNNLLSVVIGNLEFLRMDVEDPELHEHIDEADTAAKMGARLTKRLLAFARQGTLEPATINVNERLNAAMELLQSTIGETIALSADLAPGLWTIRADPSEVENMIINLTINARDAMPGGGRINISTSNVQIGKDESIDNVELAPGDYVCLTVTDDGSGMTEDVKARIFEPFYTTKSEGKGTGLGLASIYGFAQQSGGDITVKTEVDVGTSFTVYLPRSTEGQTTAINNGTPKNSEQKSDKNILVVEDSNLVRNLTIKQLRSLGYKTLAADNGLAAVSALEGDSDIGLVLADIAMGGEVSSNDLALWVQANKPECRLLQIADFSEKLPDALEVDASRFSLLRKPYNLEKMDQAVKEALNVE